MQYSTLRSAYGVNGFEELSRPVLEPQMKPTLQAITEPPRDRNWMTAPPSQEPSVAPSFPSTRPLPTFVPTFVPTTEPQQGSMSLAPEQGINQGPSLPPVPEPIPYPTNVNNLHRYQTYPRDPRHAYGEYSVKNRCALCKQQNDREVHLMIVYIASGVFLLLFLDTIVRLAIHLTKKR